MWAGRNAHPLPLHDEVFHEHGTLARASDADFQLITDWHIAADIDAVWQALHHPDYWPRWWPYVRCVEKLCSTRVRYTWSVNLVKPWMRRMAPLAAPIFRWNHNAVMRAGEIGLARYLNARVISPT